MLHLFKKEVNDSSSPYSYKGVVEMTDESVEESTRLLSKIAQGAPTVELINNLKKVIENKEKSYRLLVENIQDGMFILRDQRFVFANNALCDIFVQSRLDIIGKTMAEIVDISENYQREATRHIEGSRDYTVKFTTKNDVMKVISVRETGTTDPDFAIAIGCDTDEARLGKCLVSVGTIKDVTDTFRTEAMLQAFSSAIDISSDILMLLSRAETIIFANHTFEEVYGYTLLEIAGQHISVLRSGVYVDEYYDELWETIRNSSDWRGKLIEKSKDGQYLELDAKLHPFVDEDGEPLCFMVVKKLVKKYPASEYVPLPSMAKWVKR